MSNITFPERSTCPFCATLASGELDDPASASFVAASEHAVAFLDGFPLHPGHTLIVPRRHVPDLFALTASERDAIFDELLPLLPEVLAARGIDPDGWNVGVNVGEDAGQTIGHLHVHLIPRYAGDVDYDGTNSPRGGVRWVLPQRAAYWEGAPQPQESFTDAEATALTWVSSRALELIAEPRSNKGTAALYSAWQKLCRRRRASASALSSSEDS